MSIISIVRDLNQILTELSAKQILSVSEALNETYSFLLTVIKDLFLRFLKLHWIFNYILLPLKVPTSSFTFLKSEPYAALLFEFQEVLQLDHNPLILGFLNSFFFTLPVSIVHFSAIRRLLIQGIPAACYTLGGYIAGQVLFYSCILFGIQSLMIRWLTLEPFNYIFGLILIGRIIFSTYSERFIELKTWDHPIYKKFFITSFLLAWCEQGTLFPFLSNITFSSNPTILCGTQANHIILFFLKNFIYILGLIIGSIVFTGGWMWLFLRLKKYIFDTYYFLRSKFINRVNKSIFYLSTFVGLATLPFYAIFFVTLGPLGFVSEDSAFNNVTSMLSNFYINEVGCELASVVSIDPQVAEFKNFPFNRGSYLIFPEMDHTLSLEDLAYGADFAWVKRLENLSAAFVMGLQKGRDLSRQFGFSESLSSSKNKKLVTGSFSKNGSRNFDPDSPVGRLPAATPIITYRYYLNESFLNRNLEDTHYSFNIFLATRWLVELSQKLFSDLLSPTFSSSYGLTTEVESTDRNIFLDRLIIWYDLQETVQRTEETDSEVFVARNTLQNEPCFPGTFRIDQGYLVEEHPEVGMRLRQYYNNCLLFKILKTLDIGSFFNRLPRKYRLNGKQEIDLYIKRKILSEFYNNIRPYMGISESIFDMFQEFFGGSKHIASQVYRQQFIGTLRNIDKNFSLKLDENEHRQFNEDSFLKYIDYFDFGLFNGPKLKSYQFFKNKIIISTKKTSDSGNKKRLAQYKDQKYDFEKNPVIILPNQAQINETEDEYDNEDEYENEDEEVNEDEEDIDENANQEETVDTYTSAAIENNATSNDLLSTYEKDSSKNSKVKIFNYLEPFFADYDQIDRNNVVLSFDQPTYKLSKLDIGPEPHEELYPYLKERQIDESSEVLFDYTIKNNIDKVSKIDATNLSFENQNGIPVYTSWNSTLKKLIITNKALTKELAGSYMIMTPQFLKLTTLDYANNYFIKAKKYFVKNLKTYFRLAKSKNSQTPLVMEFLSWPIETEIFTDGPREKSPIPYLVLKEDEPKDEKEIQDDFSGYLFKAIDGTGIPFTRKWMLENAREVSRDMRPLLTIFIPEKAGYFWPGTRNKIRTIEEVNPFEFHIFKELKNRFLSKSEDTED
uniref:conserved chloroplast protein Ycf1/TIC214 n=1 Tax=Prototheca paracutis TaxID=2034905 RepID=UPI003002EB47